MSKSEHSIKLSNRLVNYSLRISNRAKYIRIVVSRKRGLEVVVPKSKVYIRIEDFLRSKSSWILKKLDYFNTNLISNPPNPLFENSLIPFLGDYFKLKNDTTISDKEIELKDKVIYLNLSLLNKKKNPNLEIRFLLKKLLKNQAKIIINQRAKHYSSQLNVKFNRVTIRDQKTRWGSCSSLKNLNFNWRLIMAPIEVLDYIVIHEMVHIIELNHSKKYWKIVETNCPNYCEYEKWLKINGHKLAF
ncbi:MAG: M48 family metallopeptidase [Spirochaetota bacterium]|nr:M48 family metallopeptidase [Spirochaetota bacterium]